MGYIKPLKFFYGIQLVIGLIMTLRGTFFLSVMSTDSPSATAATAVVAGGVTFVLLLCLGVLLPASATRELERYPLDRKLLWNWVNVLPMAFFFLPFALWQAYALWRIRGLPEDEWKAAPQKSGNSEQIEETLPEENFDSAAYAERRLRELSRELDDAERK
jgi:protein-S-isoprenylcysteine O-methyltransferase Ste14